MTFRVDPGLIPAAPDLAFEFALWENGLESVAGIDEAGRGAWAGPVTAAVVVFPAYFALPQNLVFIRDSKQLSAEKRTALEPLIKQKAMAWSVGWASNQEIDCLGILPATRLAMTRALELLKLTPQHLLIDALFIPEYPCGQTGLLKGDQRALSIAAASILAKTARDKFMEAFASKISGYAFERNKGYGTRAHQAALSSHGPCSAHRFSYAPVKRSLEKQQMEG